MATPPDAPTGLAAEFLPEAGDVRISWTAPTDNGSPIIDYEYRYKEAGSGSFVPGYVALGSAATFQDFPDDIVGQTYQFRALNLAGTGPWSAEFRVVRSPGPPTNLRATFRTQTGDVRISWTPPAQNGGSPITDYQYRYKEAGSDSFEPGTVSLGHTRPYEDFPDDIVGQTYIVRAVNSAGEGSWSEEFVIPDPNAPDPDTPTVTLVLTPTSISESGSDNTATLTATLSSVVSGSATTIAVRANPATAVDLSGTTLTIPPGQTASAGAGITVTAVDNEDDAPDARVTISGTVTESRRAGPADVTLTIADDDGDDGGDGGDDDGGDDGGTGGGGGGGGGGTPNRAPETAASLAPATVRVGTSLEIGLSGAFDDPDNDDLTYRAESSDTLVATVATEGGTLTVRGVGAGTARITVTATDADNASVSQAFTVTVEAAPAEPAMVDSPGPAVWLFPSASDPVRQGFVRVLNHSDADGEATVTATDDAGAAYEPVVLALGPRQVLAFNSDDLEAGNPAKGLTGSTGPGTGGWRLAIESDTLDVEALAYVRTSDGFVTGMNDVAPLEDGGLAIATFNPGSNVDQMSLLRLVNPGDEEAEATVTGVDDAGLSPGGPVLLTLPAGASCTVDAAQLESGNGLACGAPQGGLGDGTGKWRLTVASDAPLVAMSLLSSPAGHLTNLSGKGVADDVGDWHVDLFPAASAPLGRQGFVRVTNRSNVDGRVTILAYDDTDTRYETLHLALGAGETAHFNSDDLEMGNRSKGLTGSTGSGIGPWRLRMYSGLDIDANAYVRTTDGFLTAMNVAAPRVGAVRRIAFFNPGGNEAQVSVLRLVNRSSGEAAVSIDATDDLGLRPGTTVRVRVPATDAVELTAAELESGEADAIESGALGDGHGKWRLRVESNRAGAVLSLLSSPSGHLTNLSHADGGRGLGDLPTALLPPPEAVTLTRSGQRELQGRWSAVAGVRYDVDVLRDGVRDEDRSLTRARSTSFRWTHLLPGTYTIRTRSVNEDRVGGPWRGSDEVVID